MRMRDHERGINYINFCGFFMQSWQIVEKNELKRPLDLGSGWCIGMLSINVINVTFLSM